MVPNPQDLPGKESDITEPRGKVAATWGCSKSRRRPPLPQGLRTCCFKVEVGVWSEDAKGTALWALLPVSFASDGVDG